MNIEDKVNTQHPTYIALKPKRDVFAAVKGGTDALHEAGKAYLPKFPGESDTDYKARLMASTSDGIVPGGVESLTGSVFEGKIDTKGVNAEIQPYLTNIDNEGTDFDMFARRVFDASFDGFSLIIVDTPAVKERPSSLGDGQAQGVRPYMRIYTASSVINWRFQPNPITKKPELSLLVLREQSDIPKGEYASEKATFYRVYRKVGLVVTQERWKENKDATGSVTEFAIDMPRFTMEQVEAIPAAFVGKVTDDPKLLIESRLELKAYQKESTFDQIEYWEVPTLVLKGRKDDAVGKPIGHGMSYVHDIPIEGDAFYLQIDATGNDSLKATIKGIKDTIAARLDYIAQQPQPNFNQDKTATEVIVEDQNKQSRLVVWADELSDGLTEALDFFGQLLGIGKGKQGEIVLRTSWTIAKEKQEAEMMIRQQEKGEPTFAN